MAKGGLNRGERVGLTVAKGETKSGKGRDKQWQRVGLTEAKGWD